MNSKFENMSSKKRWKIVESNDDDGLTDNEILFIAKILEEKTKDSYQENHVYFSTLFKLDPIVEQAKAYEKTRLENI